MSKSPKLGFNYLAQHQASKDILINENFDKLDKLIWMTVLDLGLVEPPKTPKAGDMYVIGKNPTKDWEKKDNQIAMFRGTAGWDYYEPNIGTTLYVAKKDIYYMYNGTNWVSMLKIGSNNPKLNGGVFQNVSLMGINTTAKTGNNLAVNSPKTTIQSNSSTTLQIDKKASKNQCVINLSTDFSTKAQIGLLGDDNLKISVSKDGKTFQEGISIQGDTGQLIIKNGCYIQKGLQFENNNQSLDSYDFGSWTPTLEGEKNAGTADYDYQSGSFIKIGNMIFVHLFIRCTDTLHDSTGNLVINGLPFEISSSTNFSGNAIMDKVTKLPDNTIPHSIAGMVKGKKAHLLGMSPTGFVNMSGANVGNKFEIRATFVYETEKQFSNS